MLMWNSSGARDVEENGLFLGKFDFATYTSVEVPLGPGDWALFYTDGISETTNPEGTEFGSERLRSSLNVEQDASADAFANRLLEELDTWSVRGKGEELDDDLTVVVLHVRE